MERTKEQWQAIGKVLAHGIYPGCMVRGVGSRETAYVPETHEWAVGVTGSVYIGKAGSGLMICSAPDHFATVIDHPKSLSGKEVGVTIDGQTYTAIIK